MKSLRDLFAIFQLRLAPAVLLAAVSPTQAATIWNGPKIGFYHTSENNLTDVLTSVVWFYRNTNKVTSVGGLYNPVLEAAPLPGISPKGTKWAIGTLSQLTNGILPMASVTNPCPLEAGQHPPGF